MTLLAAILVAFTMPPLTLPPSAPPIVLPPPALALPKPAPKPAPRYVSPPGYHRHLTYDGRVIEHSDNNSNHQGMIQTRNGIWPQYDGPRAPDVRQAQPQRIPCPPGVK